MKNTGNKYDWQAMFVITILMFIGFITIYFTWNSKELTYNNFYNYIYQFNIAFIIALFFIGVGLYCWYMYINNVIIKPKNKVLYLKSIEHNHLSFINKKGKQYFYKISKNESYDIGKFYIVSKTRDVIRTIVGLSDDKFNIKNEKTSYWLNFYSPIGDFENVLILPILYIIFIPGFLSLLTANGFHKILGLLLMIIPCALIIYDIIYKLKKAKAIKRMTDETNNVDFEPELIYLKTKALNILSLFPAIIEVLGGLLFTGFCLWIIIKTNDIFTRIFIVPFLICGLAILLHGFVSILFRFKEHIQSRKILLIF